MLRLLTDHSVWLPWLQIANGTHKPLLIAAGGGGKGYNSHSGDQKEITDMDPKVLGRNGLSAAAGILGLQFLSQTVDASSGPSDLIITVYNTNVYATMERLYKTEGSDGVPLQFISKADDIITTGS